MFESYSIKETKLLHVFKAPHATLHNKKGFIKVACALHITINN